MQCDVTFCGKHSVDYDDKEEMHLCAKHKKYLNVARNKGKLVAFKQAIISGNRESYEEFIEEWI